MESFFNHRPYYDNYYSAPPYTHYPSYQYPSYHQQPIVDEIYHPTPTTTTTRPCYEPPHWFDENYHTTPTYQPPETRKKTTVPVNFVSKKKPSRSDYAIKIQKAFRAFRIRKNVKKILDLQRQVDDVERSFLTGDSVELIKCNYRERLKVNEILMSILFKLDSINGLTDEIRVCRKSVIRKAIMLQEKIDSLANETLEKVETMEVEEKMQVESNSEKEVEAWENVEFVDAGEDEGEGGTENRVEDGEKVVKDEWFVLEESKGSDKLLLEKMVEDNQMLMEMVADLCQKNATQTKLISSLSSRVDQLEQAMNDRLRRKKENKINKKKMSLLNQYFD